MNHDFFNKSLTTLNKNNKKSFWLLEKCLNKNNLSSMV